MRSVRSALALLSLAASFAACAHAPPPDAPPMPSGRAAFRFDTLDGKSRSIAELRGRVVVVTVIATWADPALLEVPELKRLYAAFPRSDLEIVCIALDDKLQMVKIFARTFQIPYLVATVEDRATFTAPEGPLGSIRILPTSFLIDRDGNIRARSEGVWPDNALVAGVGDLVRGH